MGTSLPKLPRAEVDLGDDGGADLPLARAPQRVSDGSRLTPVRPLRVPRSDAPNKTPTLQSLESAKLAEQETRLARSRGRTDDDPRSGVTSSSDRIAAVRSLYAEGDADAALALAAKVTIARDSLVEESNEDDAAPPADPFGGLVPVEDDPYGGLIPVEDDQDEEDSYGGLQLVHGALDELDDPTAMVPAVADGSRIVARSELASHKVPRMLVDAKGLADLPIDPRAAFIIANVDGIQSIEEILDVCAMAEVEALELIERLCSMGVLAID